MADVVKCELKYSARICYKIDDRGMPCKIERSTCWVDGGSLSDLDKYMLDTIRGIASTNHDTEVICRISQHAFPVHGSGPGIPLQEHICRAWWSTEDKAVMFSTAGCEMLDAELQAGLVWSLFPHLFPKDNHNE